jgi:hypothetical protein
MPQSEERLERERRDAMEGGEKESGDEELATLARRALTLPLYIIGSIILHSLNSASTR